MIEDRRWRQSAVWTPSDPAGSTRFHDLCLLLQDAAGAHVAHLGLEIEELKTRNLTWMLARFRVRVVRYPDPGAKLTVTTWSAGIARLFALRDFRVTAADGAVVALATSGWLLVDLGSRRPTRPDSLIAHLHVADRALEAPFEKLDVADAVSTWACRHVVRAEDIDINGHVTNTAYIAWVEQALSSHRPAHCAIGEMEIHFLAEVFRDDAARVEGSDGMRADGTAAVRIVRETDAGVAARAIVRWNVL